MGNCGSGMREIDIGFFASTELNSFDSQTTLPGTVLYFFFKDDHDEQRSAMYALCGLLHQLFRVKRGLLKHAMEVLEEKGRVVMSDLHSLWVIFTRAVTDVHSGGVIAIVDGLDECEASTRSRLVSYLMQFYEMESQSSTDRSFLKLIVTSRPYLSIENEFEEGRTIRLAAEDETNSTQADIELVVRARVSKFGKKRQLSDIVQAGLVDRLVHNADRTFLWVSLILTNLEASPRLSKNALDDDINRIPCTLDGVYDRILNQSPDYLHARKLLHIVVAALRPLSLREMNVALSITSDDRSHADLDLEPEASIATTIKALCGLFVRVIDSKVYLVHQTAKEFLCYGSLATVHNSPLGTWKNSLHVVDSNKILARICIWYLFFTIFESHPPVTPANSKGESCAAVHSRIKQYAEKHWFLDYAAKHWASHFQSCSGLADMSDSAYQLCQTQSRRFRSWFEVYWTSNLSLERCPLDFTPLMVASDLGLKSIVRRLLDEGASITAMDVYGRTALLRAAECGRCKVVQLLLERGANLDDENFLSWRCCIAFGCWEWSYRRCSNVD
ncbi:hypothetical protein K440DRAFT_55295 [Wilcoxina mikolae CBS 423.85]|nr:hypothetical protein K440DRAFT_55295 [Wilcoxina mikolae CBS 423.85]